MRLMPQHMIPHTLWNDGPDARSRELTPLYVEHFSGKVIPPYKTHHDCWEFSALRSGFARMDADPVLDLPAGTVSLIPPGVEHCEFSTHTTEFFWIGMQGSRLDVLRTNTIQTVCSDDIVTYAVSLWELARKSYGSIGPELDALALMLFYRFRRLMVEDEEEAADHIDKAVTYLHTHFNEDISMIELASHSGYSEGHFYRAFKRLTGKTPVQYLTDLRIREAQRWLLHTDLSIGDIAERSGFLDQRYFSRVFKQAVGISPSALRLQHISMPETPTEDDASANGG